MWPTFFVHNSLTVDEERKGLQKFRIARSQMLVEKATSGKVLTKAEMNFVQSVTESQLVDADVKLVNVSSDAGVQIASHMGAASAPFRFTSFFSKKNGAWDWWSPGQSLWDKFGMRRRIAYVPEELRDGPKPGDQLLFIDGQPAPNGDRGEDGESWDHSKTYAMLEAAGQRHKIEKEVIEEGRRRKSRKWAVKSARRLIDLRRLQRLWHSRVTLNSDRDVAVEESGFLLGFEKAITDYASTLVCFRTHAVCVSGVDDRKTRAPPRRRRLLTTRATSTTIISQEVTTTLMLTSRSRSGARSSRSLARSMLRIQEA